MSSEKILIEQLMQTSGVGFGTSGVRGLVSQMTDKVCYAYTLAFIQYMQQKYPDAFHAIVIAGDLRRSTPRIVRACSKAIIDCNLQVIHAGQVATPALTYYGLQHHIPSIMVTGSHIPDDRNGIKFNTPLGEILKADEAAIKKQQVSYDPRLFHSDGSLCNPPTLTDIDPGVRTAYLQRYIHCFAANIFAGKHFAVYQHSGVARDDLVNLLEQLGAKVTGLDYRDSFIPVDTEAIREEDIQLARQWAQAYHFDAIVSTDGDADRPLIADEQGRWFRGDIVGILCARYLGIEHIVTPVSSNTAVEKSRFFRTVVRTKIGSPYVISAMQELLSRGCKRVAGYEANGGFLLADSIDLDNSTLSALPTRDAVIVILSLLALSSKEKLPLSALAQKLPQRFTYSNRIKNMASHISEQMIATYSDADNGATRFLADFAGLFDEAVEIQKADTTDGLRLVFSNQAIVHFRPSGNAPELRCYSEADTTAEAIRINNFCMEKLKQRLKNE